jgi:hypothetical protein
MTIAEPRPAESRLAPAVGLFALSLLPGLVALLPGIARAFWNLTDPIQKTYLTPLSVAVLAVLLVAVCAPFVGAVVVLASTWVRTRSWTMALRAAAKWTAILGGIAFVAVMATSGGF